MHSKVNQLYIYINISPPFQTSFPKEEWIKKMWYIYTMEYYSAIKRNKIGSFVVMWMDLDTVRQNEVNSEKVSYSNIYVESREMVLM